MVTLGPRTDSVCSLSLSPSAVKWEGQETPAQGYMDVMSI